MIFDCIRVFLIGFIFFTACAQTPAHASGKVVFDCPDLHNDKKRSIEPLYQGYDGWFFRDNDIKMDFSISPETAQYFGRLNAALERKGIKLVLIPLLSRALMAPVMVDHDDLWQENYDPELAKTSYENLVNTLKAAHLDVISLLPLADTYATDDPYKYNFKRDIHWKPEGARIIAQEVATDLKALPNYDALSKVKTVTKKREEVGRSGTIMEEIQKLCNGNIEAESYNPYEYERIIEGNADALFGSDSAAIPVALVGTSFSAVDEFNFLPFVEENSKVEMANFSIAGGGMFTSIISYLSSPFFHANVPPVMLWETQSVYDFNKGTENGFRQAIAAVEGPCPADRTVASSTVSLTGEEKPYVLLDKLKGNNVKGSNYYLDIVSDNLGFQRFALEMDYDNQDGEWFPVDRSDRYNNQGHYYIELSDKISGNLDKITMKEVGNALTKLDIKLCRKPEAKTAAAAPQPEPSTTTPTPTPEEKTP